MEEIVQMPPGCLQGPELLSDAEDWDSTAILEFMALVDSRLGLTLDVDAILASETYDDLYSLVERLKANQ